MKFDEIDYYPFIVSINMCDGNCNPIEDLFGRISVPYRTEDMNQKVFNMVEGIDKSKTLAGYICVDMNVMIGNVSLGKNRALINVSVGVKKQ